MKYLAFSLKYKPFINTVKIVLSSVIILAWITAACFFLFYYRFSFNYEIYLSDQYKLFFSLPFLIIVLTGLLLKRKFALSVLHIIALMGIAAFLLLFLFSKYYSWGNEYFTVIAAIVFISSGLLLLDNIIYAQIAIIFLLLLFFYELYTGVIQWFKADDGYENVSLAITGTLQNSGVYACYLIINFPFLYWLLLGTHFNCKLHLSRIKINCHISIFYWIKRIIFGGIILLSCFIIFKTQSRTACFALAILSVSFLIIYWGKSFLYIIKKIPKAIFFSSVIVLCGALIYVFYYLFNLKKLSAIGRLMRIDITLQHAGDMFWFGTGLGRFTWYYPQWQAEYFATHPNPPKSYFMSAGESYIIFNEYLQLFKEVGLIAFILFVWVLIVFFKTKVNKNKSLLNAAKLTVVAILACGFTSYPLHVNIFLFILLFCFVIVLKRSKTNSFLLKKHSIKHNGVKNSALSVLLIIAIAVSFVSYGKYKAAMKWNDTADNYAAPDESNDNINNVCELLYPYLKDDGKFLTEYGITLSSDSSQTTRSIPILEKAKQYFISKAMIESLATAYERNRNYNKAIDYYKWLCNYLPNQFESEYKLMKTYLHKKDTLNVLNTADHILSMTVKIPSQEIEQIKKETKFIIDSCKQNVK